MDAKAFFQKVALMRKWQKDYFKNRSQTSLRNAKVFEVEIDNEIERVNKILSAGKGQPQQASLFND